MAKIEAEAIEHEFAVRKRFAQEIETLKRSSEPRLQQLVAAAASASEKHVAAEAAFKLVRDQALFAQNELAAFDHRLRLGVTALENELIRTADPRIDEQIARWRLDWERFRNTSPPVIGRNAPATGQDIASAKRIGDRCTELLEATQAGAALKLLALSPEELQERLSAIEHSITPAFS